MFKKAIKRIFCILLFAVMLLADGGIAAVQPEEANLKIIDLSKWNNSINWQKASLAVDGVIARIGFRGSVIRDSIAEDDLFYSHYQGCQTYGVPFGCYFYSLATTVEQAKEEARWVISTLKKYNCKPDLPIYIDMEDYIVQNETTSRKRTDIAKAFCQVLFENGYYPGVYANRYWLSELLFPEELSDCSIWIAQYASECTYEGKYDMWQYTDSGSVNGIAGKVDINTCYRNYPEFIKKYGFNGYPGSVDYIPDGEAVVDASAFGMYEIATQTLNVRTGPGTEYMSLGTLSKDFQVYVFGSNNGWGAIRFGNSLGWISLNTQYCKKLSDFNTSEKGIGFYTVNADTLNVRNGPSTAYATVDKFGGGEQIYINKIENGWGSFYYDKGLVGWVSLDYVDFTGTVNFSGNGATGGMNHQLIKKGESVKLNKSNFTSGDKEFSGWATSPGGRAVYSDCDTITMGDSNIVLYAVFGSQEPEELFTWGSGVTVTGEVVSVDSLMIKSEDFASRYLNLSQGATVTYDCIYNGVIGTGTQISVSSDSRKETYTVCLKGDSNGDSMCDGLDLADAVECVNATREFTSVQKNAMDLDKNGTVNASDINLFKELIF